MTEYFRRFWQSAIVIWAILAAVILVTSTIYASLNAAGISNDNSLLISCAVLIIFMVMFLLLFPISLLNSDKENNWLSSLRLLLRRGTKERDFSSGIEQSHQTPSAKAVDDQQRAWL